MTRFGIGYRYFAKELIAVFFVTLVVLLTLTLGGRLTGYLQDAATGRLAADALWYLLALRMPEFLQVVLPFSFFLSVLVTLGRFYADNEAEVLVMAGVGPAQLLTWLGSILLPLTLLVGYLSMSVTPSASATFSQAMDEQRHRAELDVLTPATFKSFSGGTRVSYAETVDRQDKTLRNVFLNESREDVQNSFLAAEGRIYTDPETGTRFLELREGTQYSGIPGQADYTTTAFQRLVLRLDLEPLVRRVDSLRTLPFGDLHLRNLEYAREWHWRLALPLLTIVSGLCALGLAKVRPRAGRFARMVPGLLVLVLYYGAVLAVLNLFHVHTTMQLIGLWPVHIVFACLAYFTMRRSWSPA